MEIRCKNDIIREHKNLGKSHETDTVGESQIKNGNL